jgi:hypothetical protein
MRLPTPTHLRAILPLALLAAAASAFPSRAVDEGELRARTEGPPLPEILLDADGVARLFGARAARLAILHAGPHWAGTAGHRAALWLVDFSVEPIRPVLVRTDAHTWIGDPSISPDGTRVVYHDGHSIYVCRLEEDGPEATEVGPGYDPRWWTHPETGDEYIIYVSTKWENSADVRGDTYVTQIENGGVRPAGDRKLLVNGYALRGGRSRDGRYMSTAQPGWVWAELDPLATEDALVRVIQSRHGGHCNVSMSQDPAHSDRFLWLDGPHRKLFYDPSTDASIPPLAPYREYTYTEWSTHGNFMTASFYGAGIREFEPERHVVGVYSWSEEAWIPVARGAATHHLWVEETADDVATSPQDMPVSITEDAAPVGSETEEAWPTDRDGLVFLWETAAKPAQTFDAAGLPSTDIAAEPTARGRVRYTRDGAMSLEGGSFHVPGVAEAILPTLRAADAVSLEAWVTAETTDVRRQMPMVASPRVYGLWQRRDRFWFSMGGASGKGPRVEAGVAQHLVLTFRDETMRAYLDGALAYEWPAEHPPMARWTVAPLVFGAAENAARTWVPWRGRIEGVAVYGRELGADEIRANHTAYAARVASRLPVTASAATGRLTAAPILPDPSQSPYRRAWAAFEYEAEHVHAGDVRPGRILVARYVWMDGEKLPAAYAKPGDRHELLLEPYESNPHIHSERQFHLDDVDLDMPMFYDVGPLTEE